jgi:alpha-tubulin suppressor-like RCC1 family protein
MVVMVVSSYVCHYDHKIVRNHDRNSYQHRLLLTNKKMISSFGGNSENYSIIQMMTHNGITCF